MSSDFQIVNPNEDDHILDTKIKESIENQPAHEPWKVPEEPTVEMPTEEATSEEAAPQVEEEVETQQEESEPVKWDGNPESLPPELQSIHKDMVRGMNQKFQGLADERKKLEAERSKYETKLESLGKQAKSEADPPPSLDNSSEDAYNRSIQDLIAWNVRQQTQKQQDDASQSVMEVMEKQKRMEQNQAAADWDRRCQMIEKSDGYTDVIGQQMVQLAQEHPLWSNAPQTDEGMKTLFEHVRAQSAATAAGVAETQRKSTASQRTVDRPAGRGKTKKAAPSPADAYADTFSEIGRDTAREMGLSVE